jgi:transcriptional regulator with XRE-family HTH domain
MTAAIEAAPAVLADLLVRHRIAAGLRQAELASLSGLSERTLRDLERGATVRPRRHSVLALASALELTGAELSAFLVASAFGRASSDPGGVTTARLDPLVGRHTELRSLHEMIVEGRHRLMR